MKTVFFNNYQIVWIVNVFLSDSHHIEEKKRPRQNAVKIWKHVKNLHLVIFTFCKGVVRI